MGLCSSTLSKDHIETPPVIIRKRFQNVWKTVWDKETPIVVEHRFTLINNTVLLQVWERNKISNSRTLLNSYYVRDVIVKDDVNSKTVKIIYTALPSIYSREQLAEVIVLSTGDIVNKDTNFITLKDEFKNETFNSTGHVLYDKLSVLFPRFSSDDIYKL